MVLGRRNGWERRGDEYLNLHLGSWGVVPEVLEISKLGHDVAEHLVEPPAGGLHVQRLVSILTPYSSDPHL